eukprot:g12467.t1
MANADLARIINSTEVQSVLRPKMERYTHGIKRNALKSKELMEELNPGSTERRAVHLKSSQKGTPEPWNPSEKTGTMPMPVVLQSPLRPDLVREVHRDMAKNKRQAYAVKPEAGYDTAAESWCTGRAVARIPRAPGGGTHRAGQAAFGNQAAAGEVGRWSGAPKKKGYTLPRAAMANADLARIINSTEVQSVLRPKMERYTHGIKRNALKSKELMEELNPGSTERRAVQLKSSQKGTPEPWSRKRNWTCGGSAKAAADAAKKAAEKADDEEDDAWPGALAKQKLAARPVVR